MTCVNPIKMTKYAPTDAGMDVPCGKCTPCRIQRASEWAIRAEHELEEWDHASFIRLSYSDDNLPPGGNVDKRALQLFIKRLRKRLASKLAYLACGEYGEKTERPHYHVLLYGYDRQWRFRGDDKLHYHPCFQWNGKVWNVVRGPLTDAWPHGHVTLGTASVQSARYIAGYTLKSNVGRLDGTHHDGRNASFFLVSRGIGKRYCIRNAHQLRRELSIPKNGKRIGLPRQYHVWLGTDTETKKLLALDANQEIYDYWKSQNKDDETLHAWIMADRRAKAKLNQARRDTHDRQAV